MDHIVKTLGQHGVQPFSVEGQGTCVWILMDFSDLVVHIFKSDARGFYALERLWGDAPRLAITKPRLSAPGRKSEGGRRNNLRAQKG